MEYILHVKLTWLQMWVKISIHEYISVTRLHENMICFSSFSSTQASSLQVLYIWVAYNVLLEMQHVPNIFLRL